MEKYDLVAVGSSFATSFFLKKYLQKASPKARVLVLERGRIFTHAERMEQRRKGLSEREQSDVWDRSSIITENKSKPWVYQLAFGGNSNCWFGGTLRFMPGDFQLKSRYGVGSDWPITYEELDPYYSEAEMLMSVSGPAITPFPKTTAYPQPPHIFNTVDKLMHQKYGRLYTNQPTARSRVAGHGRNACCVSNECSTCPANAKFTIENSQLGVYEDPRVKLVLGAQVLQLDIKSGQAEAVVYEKDNEVHKASGEVIALGANAIFNSHILLKSGDTSKWTGKGIGEQAGVYAIVKLDGLNNWGGSTHVTANGYMLYDGDHRRQAAACLMESNNNAYIRLERGKYRQIVQFRMIFEDLPEERNYVALSEDEKKPLIRYEGMSDYCSRGIDRMKKELPSVLECLPVEDIKYQDLNTESHILGTTRMSSVSEDGVIDRHMIHHKFRNVFVLGGGGFPTYSPANPTLTLSALSLFAADNSF